MLRDRKETTKCSNATNCTNISFIHLSIVNRRILVYNICLINISKSVSDGAANQFWILTAHSMLTRPMNTSPMYWILTVQQRRYELIRNFVTQNFSIVWRTVSPWILNPKSQKFHHILKVKYNKVGPSLILS